VYACHLHNHIELDWIEFEPVTSPSGSLRCNHGGTAPKKAVEDHAVPVSAIPDGVSDQSGGLNGRVKGKQVALLTAPRERIGARIIPHIGSIATILSQLDVVAMRAAPALE
jgi:hypothetical protein